MAIAKAKFEASKRSISIIRGPFSRDKSRINRRYEFRNRFNGISESSGGTNGRMNVNIYT